MDRPVVTATVGWPESLLSLAAAVGAVRLHRRLGVHRRPGLHRQLGVPGTEPRASVRLS
ncbi:hypothetical protein K7640_26145 [Micromonospora sp. PLK6-60]|uniref:hypothetical protein n=1 Tax=Micromonospora sp. PLK6-60 TaxID=2873383 RepID=UPI001CA6EE7F|nr:hypothetical protein [Micromonospora sp. PLK6-60]MBY8875320.1 hypothetical protein [Micromonospora sp. PLK6-60]